MLQRLGKDDHERVFSRVVSICSLLPDTIEDPRLAVDLLERTAAANRNPLDPKAKDGGLEQPAWLGMALYRAGRFQEAAQRLEVGYKDDPRVAFEYFLAMTHRRLGHAAEARKWLDQAVQHTEWAIKNRPAPSPSRPPLWGDYVQFEHLPRSGGAD